MQCFKCGHELPPDALFCPHCGQNNDNTPHFCVHCGTPLDKTMKFCEKCGTPVSQAPAQEEAEEKPSAEEIKEKAEEVMDKLNGLSEEGAVDIPAAPAAPAPSQVVHTASSATSSVSQVVQTASPVAPAVAPIPPASAPVPPSTPGAVHTASSVATNAVHTAGSVVGSVATEVVHTAGTVAVAGVKKAGSAAKTFAILAVVLAFVIGAAAACLNFFVPAPEDTVDKLITSMEELNYDDMFSCFDSTTEKQIRAIMGITGDLLGSLTGISIDLEDLMALAPSMAPYLDIPDLGIVSAETVLYADCSKAKIMQYCETANSGGSIPTGYLSDNAIINFLQEYNITLPGLENLIAEAAIVKITLTTGEVGYLPLINEGWGDWRIPIMDLAMSEGLN